MMRTLYYISLLIMLTLMVGCIYDDPTEVVYDDNDYVMLQVSSPAFNITRADTIPLSYEDAVKHLDVFIFLDNNGNDSTIHYERIAVNASQGTVHLKVKRNSFIAHEQYYVYVIANSTYSENSFAAIANREQLRLLKQEDYRIHVTGQKISDAPTHFLMDGIAYLKGHKEPVTPSPSILYNGNDRDETILKVRLRRAAAKIVVKLRKGKDVTFNYNQHLGYYVKNMPYSTMVLQEMEPHQTKLRIPEKTTGEYFMWDDNEVTITAYTYSHSWLGESFFEHGTSLIVNIPITYNDVVYTNSYYQIILNPESAIERNTCYEIAGTINAPGAEESDVPLELTQLKYKAVEWSNVDISISNNNAPIYLSVNKDTVRMYNIDRDSTTLKFSSSSPVTVTTVSSHFIDKFGIKQSYPTTGINGVPDSGIAGEITINSPIPTNNTIRYIELLVRNEEGIEKRVYVEQYPLVYITNQQGWYSYRDDFKTNNSRPTTYQHKGDRIVAVGLSSGTWNNNHIYTNDSYNRGVRSNYFWQSKVVSSYNERTGKSTTSFYEWSNYGSGSTASVVGTCESNTNARMYHVRITATSEEFTIGRPRIDSNGYTDSSLDNAQLVSPSFMIASRLGAIYSTYGNLNNISDTEDSNRNGIPDRREIFNIHCANYVEVYKDENGNAIVLDNWRLPTEAELKIIESLQGGENEDADAIDYLLNGRYYMSASGPVFNNKASQTGDESAIRCVRDAY